MKPKQTQPVKILAVCNALAIAGMTSPSARAASATLSATPTNGGWEAAAGETNWTIEVLPGRCHDVLEQFQHQLLVVGAPLVLLVSVSELPLELPML